MDNVMENKNKNKNKCNVNVETTKLEFFFSSLRWQAITYYEINDTYSLVLCFDQIETKKWN